MAYQTGTATSLADLFDKLEEFARLTGGYTTQSYTADGTGKRLHISKTIDGSARHFDFRSYINESTGSLYPTNAQTLTGSLLGRASTGYSGASPWYAQAGGWSFSYFSNNHYPAGGMAGIVGAVPSWHGFHFSGTGYDVIYFFAEYPAGYFQRVMFGYLPKYGTWTGGQFFFGSVDHTKNTTGANCLTVAGAGVYSLESPFAALYVSGLDGFTGWLVSKAWPSYNSLYLRDSINLHRHILNAAPSQWNGIAPLDPLLIYADADAAPSSGSYAESDPFQPLGYLPNCYLINLKELVPGGLLSITTDDFRVFPLTAKSASAFNVNASPPHSGYIGLAVFAE